MEYPLPSGQHTLYDDGRFSLSVNPTLSDKRRVMALTRPGGRVWLVFTPDVLEQLDISAGELSETGFRHPLNRCGLKLHSPDLYFHFAKDAKPDVLCEPDPSRAHPGL